MAAVKELAKSVKKTCDTLYSQKYKWKFQPPAPGDSVEKQVNGGAMVLMGNIINQCIVITNP